jgi:hypothetical protein
MTGNQMYDLSHRLYGGEELIITDSKAALVLKQKGHNITTEDI